MDKLYGGIEFGGSKVICAIGDANGQLIAQTTIPTKTVDETVRPILDFFHENLAINKLGVGAFGPIDLNPSSNKFGFLLDTPKPGWSNFDIKGLLEKHLNVPVIIETDVNCAAIGEKHYGVAKEFSNFIYLTVGTGIGGGVVINGELFHGISHLEMGHVLIPHEPFEDSFAGICRFHKDCFEGIASGVAMEQRYGKKCEAITETEPWALEAKYIASAIINFMMSIGPELIVLGGGLMNHVGLLESVRSAASTTVNGYIEFPDLERYIVKSSSETNGVLGAIRLASLTG